jgi:hypothetical protein
MTYQLSNMQETSAPLAAYYLIRGTLEYTSHELPKLLLAQAEAIVSGRNFEGLLVPELQRDHGARSRRSRYKRARARYRSGASESPLAGANPRQSSTSAAAGDADSSFDIEAAAASDFELSMSLDNSNSPSAANHESDRDMDVESRLSAQEQHGGRESGSESDVNDVMRLQSTAGAATDSEAEEAEENAAVDEAGDEKRRSPPPTYHSITQLYDYMNRSPLLAAHSLYSYVANFRKAPMGRRKIRNSENSGVYTFKDEHVQHLTHVDLRRIVPAVPLLLGGGSRLPDTTKLDQENEEAVKAREAYARKALILFRPFQRIEELKLQSNNVDSEQLESESIDATSRSWWDAWSTWSAQIDDPAVLEARQHLSFMQEYWNGKHVSNDRASELRESWLAQFASEEVDESYASDRDSDTESKDAQLHESDRDTDSEGYDNQYDQPGEDEKGSDDNVLNQSHLEPSYFPMLYDGDEAKHAIKAIQMRVQQLNILQQASAAAEAATASEGAEESAMEIAASDHDPAAASNAWQDLRLDTATVTSLLNSRDYMLPRQAGSSRDVLARIHAIQGIWPDLPAQWQDITRLQWPRVPRFHDLASSSSSSESAAIAAADQDFLTSQRAADIKSGALCFPSLYEVAEAMSLKEEQQAAFIPPAQRLIDYFESKYTGELQLQQIRSRARRPALRQRALPAPSSSLRLRLKLICNWATQRRPRAAVADSCCSTSEASGEPASHTWLKRLLFLPRAGATRAR